MINTFEKDNFANILFNIIEIGIHEKNSILIFNKIKTTKDNKDKAQTLNLIEWLIFSLMTVCITF